MIQSMSYVGLEHVGNSILFIINMSPDQLTTILAIARMSRSNASKDRSVDVTRSSNSRNRDDWSKRPDEISTSKSVLRVKFVLVRGVAEDWTWNSSRANRFNDAAFSTDGVVSSHGIS